MLKWHYSYLLTSLLNNRQCQVQVQNRLAKSAQHQLQRTAAMPLLFRLGSPAKARSFMRVSSVPPLPLSFAVGLSSSKYPYLPVKSFSFQLHQFSATYRKAYIG